MENLTLQNLSFNEQIEIVGGWNLIEYIFLGAGFLSKARIPRDFYDNHQNYVIETMGSKF